jgi:hypothetical protein
VQDCLRWVWNAVHTPRRGLPSLPPRDVPDYLALDAWDALLAALCSAINPPSTRGGWVPPLDLASP